MYEKIIKIQKYGYIFIEESVVDDMIEQAVARAIDDYRTRLSVVIEGGANVR